MLGVQLYDLISQAGLKQEQVVAFYSFMSQLGMAAQAIDIVYQLNASEDSDPPIYQRGASPLESLSFGANGAADVTLKSLSGNDRLLAFRYHDLILLKNYSGADGLGPRPAARARRILPHLSRAAHSGRRSGPHLPGAGALFQREEERLAAANFRAGEQGCRRSATRTLALARKRARSDFRFEGAGEGVARRRRASLNGVKLKAGTQVEATLEDRIVFHNDSELDLLDLRRRARAMGGRFQLKASKSEYLVSNNPSLLEEDDILLSPGTSGDVLLKIFCDYDKRVGTLEVIEADRPIMVGETPVRTHRAAPGWRHHPDRCRAIPALQFFRADHRGRAQHHSQSLEVVRRHPSLQQRRDRARRHLFHVNRGELVCVMGASGSGKSTLMKVLGGQLQPTSGQVLLNGQPLYDNLDTLKRYVSYIPQDDAFDEHLTIGENLQFAAAIRSPHLSRRDRTRRLEGKLIELGLSERRDSIVGSPVKKTLSGGERKRLNIGLDMIGSADVYLFDEPTSGLSSKDSEHVIEIIRGMAHNKIIIVTIHQPSSKLFQMFHKAILLDKGGRLVFFGTPTDMLRYFAEAEHQHQFGADLGACPSCGTTRPEFIFDVLETPLRDLSGDIIYEENNRGQLVAGAPLLAGILARQIRGVPPDPGRQAGVLAARSGAAAAAGAAAEEARAHSLA